jgi:hypothetical protein
MSLRRIFGLDRDSWSLFRVWLPTSVAACVLPLEFALLGAAFEKEIVAHPIASIVLQSFVFIGGNLADNLLKEKQAWFEEPPRLFPTQELLSIFHVGIKLTVLLGAVQYIIFMTILRQPLWDVELVITSAITMTVITAFYPTLYTGIIYLVLKAFPAWRGQVSKFALPVRNILMTPLASWMCYVLVAPHLR